MPVDLRIAIGGRRTCCGDPAEAVAVGRARGFPITLGIGPGHHDGGRRPDRQPLPFAAVLIDRARASRSGALIVLALIAGALSAAPASPAAAGPTFEVVDDPNRFLYDVSETGRYVLTGTPAGSTKQVIDRETGERFDADQRARSLSRGGGMIAFATEEQLVPEDTDLLRDVYVAHRDGSDVRLMSQGFPEWEFDEIGDFVDQTGAVVVGTNGALGQVAPFFVSAYTTIRIDADLPPSTGGIRVFSVQPTTFEVLWQRGDVLYSDDRAGNRRVMNSHQGTLMPVGDADLQPGAQGNIAALTHATTGAVYLTGGYDQLTKISDVVGFSAADDPVVSMSSKGDFAWEVPAPTRFGESIVTGRQLAVRRHGSETTVIESQPAGGLADNVLTNGRISDDGSTLLFTSFATNLAGTTTAATVFATTPTIAAGVPNPTPSVFTPRTPLRVLDTRPAVQVGASLAVPTAGTSIQVPMRNLHGVPSDASAVAVQLTAAEGTGIGYVSAIATGTPTGMSSNLNLDVPGEAIANFAIVPIGLNGSITVFTQAPTHVIVDLVGWFTPSVSIAASGGRYVAVGPERLLDTRPASLIGHTGVKPAATAVTRLRVTGAKGVPSTGVTAVAVNITLTETEAVGYVQVAPYASLVVGASSTANISRVGQTVAAATIVPVDANGDIAIYTQMSTHVIVDINGWFTDSTAALSTAGLFVPSQVAHRTDTRDGAKPTPGTRYTLGTQGSAAVGNITVTETVGPGFVQVGPSATMVSGATSNINPTGPGETMANFFIAPSSGGFDVFTSNGTHIVTDQIGHMTG